MRLLLALLAVLAMFANPLTAAAAQTNCAQMQSTKMAGMDMSGASAKAGPAHTMPCCDQGDHQKKSDRSCAQACMAMCAAVIPAASLDLPVVSRIALEKASLALSPRAHSPAGLDPPPKLSV
jgi:hypothetical protein